MVATRPPVWRAGTESTAQFMRTYGAGVIIEDRLDRPGLRRKKRSSLKLTVSLIIHLSLIGCVAKTHPQLATVPGSEIIAKPCSYVPRQSTPHPAFGHLLPQGEKDDSHRILPRFRLSRPEPLIRAAPTFSLKGRRMLGVGSCFCASSRAQSPSSSPAAGFSHKVEKNDSRRVSLIST